jgi:hypothetical protein
MPEDSELVGTIIDFSDSGPKSRYFAVIEVVRTQSLIVPVESLEVRQPLPREQLSVVPTKRQRRRTPWLSITRITRSRIISVAGNRLPAAHRRLMQLPRVSGSQREFRTHLKKRLPLRMSRVTPNWPANQQEARTTSTIEKSTGGSRETVL